MWKRQVLSLEINKGVIDSDKREDEEECNNGESGRVEECESDNE